MGLKEAGYDDMEWSHLAQSPVAHSCENVNESSGSKKGGKFLD
jgi:hypothetical protein